MLNYHIDIIRVIMNRHESAGPQRTIAVAVQPSSHPDAPYGTEDVIGFAAWYEHPGNCITTVGGDENASYTRRVKDSLHDLPTRTQLHRVDVGVSRLLFRDLLPIR